MYGMLCYVCPYTFPQAAQQLFPVQHIENWAFDVELLFLASRLGVAVAEESVRWQEIEGSKLDLRAPFDMLRDIVLIRYGGDHYYIHYTLFVYHTCIALLAC